VGATNPPPAECRVIARDNGAISYGPIWNWTTDDLWAHIARHQLPVNPVYATLRQLVDFGASPPSTTSRARPLER
jgi:3'-phosphoadenosine 5'-phosphosulfate sulfotransferase (PAPS reductase)/FAD synthetase